MTRKANEFLFRFFFFNLFLGGQRDSTFPFWNRWIDIPPSPYFFQLVWDWRPRFGVFFFSSKQRWMGRACLKMAVIFSFLFSSCRVVTVQPIAPGLVITNFQTSSRRAKNLKGRRMRAVRVVCAQQPKIKKGNFLSTRHWHWDRNDRRTWQWKTNFCLFIFSSGFLFHL